MDHSGQFFWLLLLLLLLTLGLDSVLSYPLGRALVLIFYVLSHPNDGVESLGAVAALVGPLVLVDVLVGEECGLPGEALGAEGTLERL